MTGTPRRTRKSEQLRKKAAEALRDSRDKERPQEERDVDRKIAEAYKGLADNQAWLTGGRSRDMRKA